MDTCSCVYFLLFVSLVCLCNADNSSVVAYSFNSSVIDVDPSIFSDNLLLPTLSSSSFSSFSHSSISVHITEAIYSSATTVVSFKSSLLLSPLASTSSLTVLPSPTPVTLTSTNLTDEFSASTSCSCDLLIQSCDTDCCCDPDCTTVDIASFSQCLNQQQQSLTQRCLPSTALFRTSLLATRGSDLFCVYIDNYPGRTIFPDSTIANTLTELNRQLILYTRTGDLATPISSYTTTITATSTIYRSGDPLTVVYDMNILSYLVLPTSLNGDACHDSNPVTYLNDQMTKCSRYISTDGSECNVVESPLNVFSYFENISLSTVPQNTNDSLISLEMRSVKCVDLIGQSLSCDSNLLPSYNSSSLTCNNVLTTLDYIIFHNGSKGIIQAIFDVTISEVSVGPVNQHFSVRYISVSDSDSNYTDILEGIDVKRSGNPGYIDGEPVLAGVLLADVVSVQVDRFNWLTLLTGGIRGECGDRRESITFRDSMKTSCVLRLPSSIVFSGCTNVGSQTLALLLGAATVNRIAINGNSNPKNLSQWIPLFGLTDVPTTFECSTVVTGINIVLLYSYTGQVGSPEALITGAQIEYITQDITTQCASLHCSSSYFTLSLHSSVSFIPSYSIPAQVLKTTSFTARTLPEDFLYPLLSTSGAGMAIISWTAITVALVNIIL